MNYDLFEDKTDTPSNAHFRLHNHDDYEIYMFFEGDAKYVVEEKNYSLEPGDIIVIRKHQMHRVFHSSAIPYHRFVLMVSPDFFVENNCSEYEEQFINPLAGADNKISAEIVHSSGLYDAFMRIKKYSDDFNKPDTPVVRAAVVEFLYLINNIRSFSVPDTPNIQLKSVITYINNRFMENISLDELEKRFYISKYHLCRIFRNATGLTVHQYITRKRLTMVRELVQSGKNYSEAAVTAGFGDYSSFYRAHKSIYGKPPARD